MVSARTNARAGFTLIELVVVIIIIAILAAVAVPKFYDRTSDAREAATLQSLSTLRGAVELYKVDNGSYPTSLAADARTYIKGPFPPVVIGGTENFTVVVVTGNSALQASDVTTAGGWLYNSTTGELRINLASHFDN